MKKKEKRKTNTKKMERSLERIGKRRRGRRRKEGGRRKRKGKKRGEEG